MSAIESLKKSRNGKPLLGRFPQICTVCYSVTLKNQNISPWSWSKIVDNTLSVCMNNIKKHIGSPPTPFICFLQIISVKGMSHCNICWFKWFWGCKKLQFQSQNLKSKTSFINQISPLNLGKITLETLFSKSGFCPIGQNLIFQLSFERVNRRYFSNQFLGTSKLFWGVRNYFDGKSMPKCSKPC